MITNDGTIIRTPADGIPMYGRSASGVIMMKLGDGKTLVNFTVMEKEEEKSEDESGAADDMDDVDETDDMDEGETDEIEEADESDSEEEEE